MYGAFRRHSVQRILPVACVRYTVGMLKCEFNSFTQSDGCSDIASTSMFKFFVQSCACVFIVVRPKAMWFAYSG